VRHIGLEDLVLGQVINDVERDSQVCGEETGAVGEAGAVIQEEALRRVIRGTMWPRTMPVSAARAIR
jgi:hypothetical protein